MVCPAWRHFGLQRDIGVRGCRGGMGVGGGVSRVFGSCHSASLTRLAFRTLLDQRGTLMTLYYCEAHKYLGFGAFPPLFKNDMTVPSRTDSLRGAQG